MITNPTMITTRAGREISLRPGLLVPAGSLVLSMDQWTALDADMICVRTPRRWDDLTQSHVGGDLVLRPKGQA